MKRFVVSAEADHDLDEIAEQIGLNSLSSAARVIENLYNAMGRLAESPGIGHWREELADKRHKFFLVHSFLIVYRFELQPIQVIRVLHAARDVQGILELDSPVALQ